MVSGNSSDPEIRDHLYAISQRPKASSERYNLPQQDNLILRILLKIKQPVTFCSKGIEENLKQTVLNGH